MNQAQTVFKIAETKEELESAFKLIYDSYYKAGLIDYNQSGLRVSPYHLLDTTTVLIAQENGQTQMTLH